MIDITNAVEEFKKYIYQFKNDEEIGFELKEKHTYGVMRMSKLIAEALNLEDEDIKLAELIGLLHDIGRFEELRAVKCFDGVVFDHAAYGVKILFEDGIIKKFTEEEKYYPIIRAAILNHSRLEIEEGLDEKCLLHSKIIRDSDKIDNLEIKLKRKPEHLFKNRVNGREEFESSMISDSVYNSIINNECVKLADRKHALDYYICVLGFVFDIYYKITYNYIVDNDYINKLIDRFDYRLPDTRNKMENIRLLLMGWIYRHI